MSSDRGIDALRELVAAVTASLVELTETVDSAQHVLVPRVAAIRVARPMNATQAERAARYHGVPETEVERAVLGIERELGFVRYDQTRMRLVATLRRLAAELEELMDTAPRAE